MRADLPQRLRPLDPVRSIKAKLGLLVAASIAASALLIYVFLVYLGWRARYGLTVSVLIGLAVTQALAHGMTSPLRQMTAAAREMAAGRSPDPVRATSRDEVGELARAFTQMAEDLQSADAQRRELLANVAHELRTPLAAVRAQLENLVDGVRPADDVALGEVLERIERLSTLLDDLLGLARADAGGELLDRRPTPVAALVREAVEEVQACRPDAVVTVAVDEDLTADLDPSRIRQVLVNLLDNATRHAGEDGRIEVAAVSDGRGTLVLDVADDGPGIPECERAAVFDRFRRGALTVAESPTGGTGLGLAIARWAVTLHGGRIEVLPAHSGCRIRVQVPDVLP